MKKIRVGILGGGGIFGAHAPGFAAMADRCSVVAVAEPNQSQHDRIRQLVGKDVTLVADYRDVARMDNVDAVDILLPHHLHAPATIAAAEAGKPVLVEKVMARNVAECDRMIEACDKAGVSLTVCHDRRYAGPWVALKRVLELGVLGDVFYWKLEHNQNVPFPKGHWAASKEGIGGGAVMSCLTHQIDALRWYAGEVASVTCMSRVIPERMEGEFAGVLAARLKSGALVNMSINWWTTSHQWGAEGDYNGLWYELNQACGPKGEAYFMHGKGTFVRLHEKTNVKTTLFDTEAALTRFVPVPWPDERGHVRCIAEWIKSLRHEPAEILTSGRECRGTVEVAEAAYLSEQTGRVVNLPLPAATRG